MANKESSSDISGDLDSGNSELRFNGDEKFHCNGESEADLLKDMNGIDQNNLDTTRLVI